MGTAGREHPDLRLVHRRASNTPCRSSPAALQKVATEGSMSRYTVMTEPNNFYLDENPAWDVEVYATAEEAIFCCKTMINDFLDDCVGQSTTAGQLYEEWDNFGSDPYIVPVDPNDESVYFVAREYVKERIRFLISRPRNQ
jgi:hypothetical protein